MQRDDAPTRAEQPNKAYGMFHFQRTTVPAHENALETAPFSQNKTHNR